MSEPGDCTYFHVLEARRAAQVIAHASGLPDDAVESLASKAGRRVAESGSVSRSQIKEMIRAVAV